MNEKCQTVNEAPKIIPELNDKFLDIKMTQKIKKGINSGEYIKLSNKNDIFVFPLSRTESIYTLSVQNEIIGAVLITLIDIKGQIYSEVTLSKRYSEEQKGFLKLILPIIQKDTRHKIISGDEHTPESIAVWIKFLRTKEKYNIQNVKVIDLNGEEIKPIKNIIWGKGDKYKEKRVILDFRF